MFNKRGFRIAKGPEGAQVASFGLWRHCFPSSVPCKKTACGKSY